MTPCILHNHFQQMRGAAVTTHCYTSANAFRAHHPVLLVYSAVVVIGNPPSRYHSVHTQLSLVPLRCGFPPSGIGFIGRTFIYQEFVLASYRRTDPPPPSWTRPRLVSDSGYCQSNTPKGSTSMYPIAVACGILSFIVRLSSVGCRGRRCGRALCLRVIPPRRPGCCSLFLDEVVVHTVARHCPYREGTPPSEGLKSWPWLVSSLTRLKYSSILSDR